MKATDELRKEHEGIGLMHRVLKAVADKFKHGEQVNAEHNRNMASEIGGNRK